jgi:hypothetical protein
MLTPLLRTITDREWAVRDADTGATVGFIVLENGGTTSPTFTTAISVPSLLWTRPPGRCRRP